MVISKEDCEVIKSFWKGKEVFSEATPKYAYYNGQKAKLKTNKVSAEYVSISDDQSLRFILDKIKCLGIKSISVKDVSIMKYSPGHYFGPHLDFPNYENDRLNRTVIIQLSDDKDYSGGDLLVKGIVQPRKIGSLISIKSNEVHEVTKITEGIRYTAAIFLLNKDIEVTQTLI